ncbi:MAG: PD-(D/E)XK nuclease family protein, partial [Dethiobacteria bacterium]
KELGFGPKYIDTQHRFILPTLPWYAIRKRLHAELLAEEMRILYVAMTRAEQKLFLLATVKDLKKELFRWQMASRPAPQPLPQYYRARAECYLDWIGPALWQHPVFCGQKNGRQRGKVHSTNAAEDGLFFWDIALYTSTEIMGPASEEDTVALREEEKRRQERLDRIRRWEPLTTTGGEETAAKITKRLSWQYPRQWAPRNYAKISVSELPRLRDAGLTESGEGTILDEIWGPGPPAYFRRPRFLGEKVLSAAERGTAYHTAMQHLKLTAPLDRHAISEQLQKMLAEGHLDPGECCIIDPGLIADFLATPLGERIIEAYPRKLWRELPFTMVLPATEVFNIIGEETPQDSVLIQGVIDCLFKENDSFVIIDYKTGNPAKMEKDGLRQQYMRQLGYYSLAIKKIWGGRVTEKYLYFLDGGQFLMF